MRTRTSHALCGTGLLLTVVEVRLFGFDLADDTLGFALAAVGAWAAAQDASVPGAGSRPGAVAWKVATLATSVAAVASLLAYTGLLGRFLAYPDRLWVDVVYLRGLAVAVLVAAVAAGLRAQAPRSSPRRRLVLGLLAALALVAGGLAVVLQWSSTGYVGPLGVLLQLAVAGSGVATVGVALACLLTPSVEAVAPSVPPSS